MWCGDCDIRIDGGEVGSSNVSAWVSTYTRSPSGVRRFVGKMSHEASYQFGTSRVRGDAQRVEHAMRSWSGVGIRPVPFGLFFTFQGTLYLEHFFGCLRPTFTGTPETIMYGGSMIGVWECIDLQNCPLVTPSRFGLNHDRCMIIKSMFAFAALLRTHPP